MTSKPKATIIVADDDFDLCELLAMKLRQSDFEVLTVMDGIQALDMIRSVRPNLVILDIIMPSMTGMEVLGEMRSEAAIANIPVILMTAERKEKDMSSGFALGIVDYIVKPFNLKDLVAQAKSVIPAV